MASTVLPRLEPNKALCIVRGSINCDEYFLVPNIVRPGQTISSTGHERRVGGKGANQAVAVHRAGLSVVQSANVADNEGDVEMSNESNKHDVLFVGTVGYDGEWIKESMHGWGMVVDWIGVDKERATGRAIIQVDTKGENSIVLFPGANHHPTPPITSLSLGRLLALYRKATHLLLQNEIPVDATVTAMKSVKDSCVVVINPSPLFNGDEVRLKIAWGRVDWLVVNKDESIGLLESLGPEGANEELTGLDISDVLMKMHHTKTFEKTGIVCTLGADGAIVSVPKFVRDSLGANGDGNGKDGLIFIPAAKAEVVRDTTGAGDCFAGYFMRGLMELGIGRGDVSKEQLRGVLERAVQAAAICVEREGTIDSIPGGEEVDKRMGK
ncbi:Ribokinase-like protein [Panaeolus papilionaceus]|nr:Ribokinase-like protein [Panaeolus papilionaceus]